MVPPSPLQAQAQGVDRTLSCRMEVPMGMLARKRVLGEGPRSVGGALWFDETTAIKKNIVKTVGDLKKAGNWPQSSVSSPQKKPISKFKINFPPMNNWDQRATTRPWAAATRSVYAGRSEEGRIPLPFPLYDPPSYVTPQPWV